MEKLVRVTVTHDKYSKLVSVETCVDGVTWFLNCTSRVREAIGHYGSPEDDDPNEYIHLEIVNRIKHLVSKGYRMVEQDEGIAGILPEVPYYHE